MLTPSHHRVHHGSDDRYLDKNHGGILVIWDKLFNTYAEEEKEPNYGLTKSLKSLDPIWVNIHEYAHIFKNLRRFSGFTNKLKAVFYGPGWRPASMGPATRDDVANRPKYEPVIDSGLKRYASFQFILHLILGLVFLKVGKLEQVPISYLIFSGATIIIGLISIGAILEGKSWALSFEVVRNIYIGFFGFCTAWLFNLPLILFIVLATISGLSVLYVFNRYRLFILA